MIGLTRSSESISSPARKSIRNILFLAAGIDPEIRRDEWRLVLEGLIKEDTRYWNRLIIPVYASIKKKNYLDLIPEDIRKVFQDKFMNLLAVQVRQQAWLKKVVQLLIKGKIPVILLKGAGSIGSLYDPYYSRLSQDIDILIRRSDAKHFTEAVREIALPRKTGSSRVFSDRHRYQQNLPIKTDLPFNIEPHFDLHPRYLFRTSFQDLWDCSLKHPMFDTPDIRILSHEHAIVYIATHSFLHLEFEPHHLVDAVRLLTICKPDMDIALRYAEQWGCLKILYLLMKQMEYWFGIPNPAGCTHPAFRRVERYECMYSNPMNPSQSDVSLKNQIRSMLLHDRISRVMLFSGSFAFKKLMDKILILGRLRSIMNKEDGGKGSPDNEG